MLSFCFDARSEEIACLRDGSCHKSILVEIVLASPLWTNTEIQPRDLFQSRVRSRLYAGDPFLVGKIGANELNLLYWLERLVIPSRPLLRRRLHLWNLRSCETNAGLKPRTRTSYRQFALLLRQAALEADHLGVWHQEAEILLYHRLSLKARFYDLFDICPWFASSDCAWSAALVGRKVFVVSPFLNSILAQYSRRELIWEARPGLLPDFALSGYKFPYLIADNCSLAWSDVYQDVLEAIRRSQCDVVLLGCGALGLPLGMEVRRLGRQAVHLGGFLQVLFGIHGGRFRRDPAYRDLINEHWVAPSAYETPAEAARVENGCYW